MGRAIDPAMVVIIGSISAGQHLGEDRQPQVPVSWTADRRGLEDAPATAVLELSPADLGSRQALREAVRSARAANPSLTAVIVRQGGLRHPEVLAENGIRIALVDEFAASGAPSRRPPPPGWSCRSAVWGLWEVRLSPPQHGWRRLMLGTSLPVLRPGGLAVIDADGMRQARGDHGLAACLDWAVTARENATAVLASVDDLSHVLERGATSGTGQRGSVLSAA